MNLGSPTLYDQYGNALIGGSQGLVRKGGSGGELAPTVFPLPVRPLSEITPQMRRRAIEATYTGRLEEAVDLYRQCVTEDGYISGLLATMSHGILGMQHSFQGDPRMVEALDDAGGTSSEYSTMFPESEAAQVFSDGIGFGIGLGQFVYSGTERAPGGNRVPRLEWRDPRWLWRNPVTMEWWFTKRDGMRRIQPGDGEWFMFTPYPNVDIWRHGPWLYITLAAIFARDAVFDRQRVSEVTTPTPVLRAEKATTKEARKDAMAQLKELAHDHRVVLPEQWTYEIVCASGEYNNIAEAIVDWGIGSVEVGLTGNRMGMQARAAFTDANVFKRTTTDRRRFFSNGWTGTTHDQGLVYWAFDNYGTTNAPVVRINVDSPEDKLAASEAVGALGDNVGKLFVGLKKGKVEPTLDWVTDFCQSSGVRVRAIQSPGPQLFDLDPKDMIAGIKIDEWRKDQGLPAVGDPRGDMMMAAAVKAGGPATPVAATPVVAPAPASGASLPAPPPAQGPADARLEAGEDPEDLDLDDLDDDELRARDELAASMTNYGYAKCQHGRTHACPRCGVQRIYSAGPPGPDGSPTYRVAWRPMGRQRRKARLGSANKDTSDPFGELRRRLKAALDRLDALGVYDDQDNEARARPEQERGPDGKFIGGGGSKRTHDDDGRPIVDSEGTKDGLGRSKAANRARVLSQEADEATASGDHEAASMAHRDAAEAHREAALKSSSPAYQSAHRMATRIHDETATAHVSLKNGGAKNIGEAVGRETARVVTGVLTGKQPLGVLSNVQRLAAARFYGETATHTVGSLKKAAAAFNQHRADFLRGSTSEVPGLLNDFILRRGLPRE